LWKTHCFYLISSITEYLLLEGWKLRNDLKRAVARYDVLEENRVSLEITSYEEHQGGENFGTSSDGSRVLEENLRKQSAIFYEAEELFKEAESRRKTSMGIIGEPGVGKTFLSNKLLQLQAAVVSQDVNQYLFHVKFRHMDFTKKLSVLEFLVKQQLADWRFEQEIDQGVLELINDSSEVYIVADGLDEADDKLFANPLDLASHMGLYDHATPDVIIKNLLAGRILPQAKKVITSRPDAFLNLHADCKPKFNVRILGLSQESQKTLGFLLCKKCDAEYSKVKEKLDANPDLRSFCYNPLQCSITVQVLRWMDPTRNLSQITSTLIFVENFLHVLKRNQSLLRELLQTLRNLTELALNGMKDGKFIFEKKDLTDLKYETLKQFLFVKTSSIWLSGESILEGDKRFFFSHLLWQEFFAAIWLMFVSDKKQFTELLKVLSDNRWKAVLKFAFGFQNNDVKKKIMNMFQRLQSKSDDSLFAEKCKAMRKFHQNALDNGGLAEPCRWALEANQPALNTDLAERLPRKLSLPLTLTQCDACAIAHALSIEPFIPRKISMESGSTTNGTILQGDSLRILMDAVNTNGHEVIVSGFGVFFIKELTLLGF